MAALKKSLLGKLAIAAIVEATCVVPSYAYTINHQPYYSTSDNVVDSAGSAGQVSDSQNYSGQVETINQFSQEPVNVNDPADNVTANANDPEVDPVMINLNDDSLWKEPVDDTKQASSVPSYARQNEENNATARNANSATPRNANANARQQKATTKPTVRDNQSANRQSRLSQSGRAVDDSIQRTARNAQTADNAPSSKGFVIPRPQYSVDYSPRDIKIQQQSNAYISVEGSKAESDKLAAEYDRGVISQLRSRNLDPANFTLDTLKEQRLSLYDREKWKDDQAKREANPFGDLYQVEELYRKIPVSSAAYYIRDGIDKTKFLDIMQRSLDRYLKHYELGITILDDNGLLLLYNNNDFPLEGISNLELAYIAGVAMNRHGDNMNMRVRYNATHLNRLVYSPFANLVLQDVQTRLRELEEAEKARALAQASGKEKKEEPKKEEKKQEGTVVSNQQRVIARVVSSIDRSEGFDLPNPELLAEQNSVDTPLRYATKEQNYTLNQKVVISDSVVKSEVELIKEWNISDARNRDRFSARLNAYTSSPIKTILYYMLNYDDPNAADLLLGYLGSTTALNFELKSRGVHHTRYNVLSSDVVQSPELNYHNASPLYDMARVFALFIKDKDVSVEVKDLVKSALDNNINSKRGIYRGISNAVRHDSPEDRSSMQVYSISGLSGFSPSSLYGVATEVAYVQYRGERFIIAIGIKGITGRTVSALKNDGDKYISFTASNIFNLLRETYPYLNTDSKLVIPIDKY